jgi:hypothetical protein
MENRWNLRFSEFYWIFNPQVSCSKRIVWKVGELKKGFVWNETLEPLFPFSSSSVLFCRKLKLYLVGALKAIEFYFNDEKYFPLECEIFEEFSQLSSIS